MKLNATLATLFLVAATVWNAGAQNHEVRKSKSNGRGGFGGIIYEISPVLGTTGISQGGGGAFLRNNFFIGGYGVGLVTNHYKPLFYQHPDDKPGSGWNFDGDPVHFDHGGLWLGKIIPLDHDFALTASGMFGWGEVGWSPQMADRRKQRLYQIEENIFVMQPKVVVGYQPLSWLRLEAGLGYRIVFTSNKQYLDTSGQGAPRWRNFFEPGDFTAPSFNFGIMFGAF